MEERAGNTAIFAFAFVIVLLGVLSIIYGLHFTFEATTLSSSVYGGLMIAVGLLLNLWVYRSLNREPPEMMWEHDPLMADIRAEIEEEIEARASRGG